MTDRSRRVLIFTIFLFSVLVGFGFGRFYAPDRKVEQTKTETKTVEVEVESKAAQATIATLREELAKTKRHTYRTETIVEDKKAGTVTTTKTEDEHLEHVSDTSGRTLATSSEVSDKLRTGESAVKTETVKAVTRERPMNRLGALVDVNTSDGRVSYGAQYQRRVLGPISLSVHVLVAPPRGPQAAQVRAGVGVSLEF